MTLAGRVTLACAIVMGVGMVIAGLLMRVTIDHSLEPYARQFVMMRQMMDAGPDLPGILAAVDWAMLLSTVVAIVVGCLISWLLGAELARSVVAVRRGLDRFAAGQLTQPIDAQGPSELQSIADAANGMARQLHQSRQLERELVAGVAHDLAHPVIGMRGTVEGIRDGLVDAADGRTIDRLLMNLDTLEATLTDLRDVAAVNAGRIQISLGDVDMPRVAASVHDAYADLAAQKGVVLELDREGKANVLVRSDEQRLHRILSNLVLNALHATAPGGSVRIGARTEAARAVVFVEDAAGAESTARIRSALEAGSGGGLGLHVVRALSSALHAEVRVREGVAGTVVEVELPVHRAGFVPPEALSAFGNSGGRN
ncbi:HAMP domain-containing histidine kinase [bacterium]|nr:MAG: HAMP domain-containing histidine kinase [bacterium]